MCKECTIERWTFIEECLSGLAKKVAHRRKVHSTVGHGGATGMQFAHLSTKVDLKKK